MISKLKFALFGLLKKIVYYITGTGISKKISGTLTVHDFLVRHLWPYQNVIEIQGSKMYVNVYDKDPSMRQTFQSYATCREWEQSTTKIFKKVVKEGNTVVDLGANIGYFTLLAAKLVGKKGKVYSFEPEPRNYNYLLKNIELNKYDNVFATQKAVSDEAGKTKLYICPYDTGHHTINQYGGIKAHKPDFIDDKKDFVEVETVTLDDFFKDMKKPIDVIKVDIEGAEMLALSGMDRVLMENKKLKMFIEFFPLLIREMGGSPEEFIRRLLEDYQFSMFVIPDDHDALTGKSVRVNNAYELMSLCKGERDIVNLFLKKDRDKGGILP
jgi:FkbM family methyltransferase